MGNFIKLAVTETWQPINGLVLGSHTDVQNVGSKIVLYKQADDPPEANDTEGKELLPNVHVNLVKESNEFYVRVRDGISNIFFSDVPASGQVGPGPGPTASKFESPITAIGTPIVLAGIDINRVHCFAGLEFFDDVGGSMPAAPSAGSVKITIQTVNSPQAFDPIPFPSILADIANRLTVSWAANTEIVKAEQDVMVVGGDFYKLIVTCNEE